MTHPVLLIPRAKMALAAAALEHLKFIDAHQKSLAVSHPALYLPEAHTEAMAANIAGIYTQLDGALRGLVNAIDETVDGQGPVKEDTPSVDLLRFGSIDTANRAHIIGPKTFSGLMQLIGFRDDVYGSYASDLRQHQVFEHAELLDRVAPLFFSDIETFITSFEDGDLDRFKLKSGPIPA